MSSSSSSSTSVSGHKRSLETLLSTLGASSPAKRACTEDARSSGRAEVPGSDVAGAAQRPKATVDFWTRLSAARPLELWQMAADVHSQVQRLHPVGDAGASTSSSSLAGGAGHDGTGKDARVDAVEPPLVAVTKLTSQLQLPFDTECVRPLARTLGAGAALDEDAAAERAARQSITLACPLGLPLKIELCFRSVLRVHTQGGDRFQTYRDAQLALLVLALGLEAGGLQAPQTPRSLEPPPLSLQGADSKTTDNGSTTAAAAAAAAMEVDVDVNMNAGSQGSSSGTLSSSGSSSSSNCSSSSSSSAPSSPERGVRGAAASPPFWWTRLTATCAALSEAARQRLPFDTTGERSAARTKAVLEQIFVQLRDALAQWQWKMLPYMQLHGQLDAGRHAGWMRSSAAAGLTQRCALISDCLGATGSARKTNTATHWLTLTHVDSPTPRAQRAVLRLTYHSPAASLSSSSSSSSVAAAAAAATTEHLVHCQVFPSGSVTLGASELRHGRFAMALLDTLLASDKPTPALLSLECH